MCHGKYGKNTVNQQFWVGKKVLLTGHTGFKGSWLTQWLLLMGAQVTGFSLEPPTDPSLFKILELETQIDHHIGDICDLNQLTQIFSTVQPDIVIHMAAQSLVPLSYQQPVQTYATNVMGTVHVLEAARKTSSVQAIVNVTSDKCYENKEWLWGYREEEPMGGYDPYSNSKGCAELVTAAYRQSFFNADDTALLASARAGNVIGGGDWAEARLIPDIIQSFSVGQPVQLRNPSAIRPWQHVLEPLSGYLQLAEALWQAKHANSNQQQVAAGWNFGPDDSQTKTVQWVTEALAQRWGDGAAWQADNSQKPHEAKLLKLDSSKARHQLNWQPQLTIEMALDWTVDWYQAFNRKQDVLGLTRQQILSYMSLQAQNNTSLQNPKTPVEI